MSRGFVECARSIALHFVSKAVLAEYYINPIHSTAFASIGAQCVETVVLVMCHDFAWRARFHDDQAACLVGGQEGCWHLRACREHWLSQRRACYVWDGAVCPIPEASIRTSEFRPMEVLIFVADGVSLGRGKSPHYQLTVLPSLHSLFNACLKASGRVLQGNPTDMTGKRMFVLGVGLCMFYPPGTLDRRGPFRRASAARAGLR